MPNTQIEQVKYHAQCAPEMRIIITKPNPGGKIILSRTGKVEYLLYLPTGQFNAQKGGFEYVLRGRRAV